MGGSGSNGGLQGDGMDRHEQALLSDQSIPLFTTIINASTFDLPILSLPLCGFACLWNPVLTTHTATTGTTTTPRSFIILHDSLYDLSRTYTSLPILYTHTATSVALTACKPVDAPHSLVFTNLVSRTEKGEEEVVPIGPTQLGSSHSLSQFHTETITIALNTTTTLDIENRRHFSQRAYAIWLKTPPGGASSTTTGGSH